MLERLEMHRFRPFGTPRLLPSCCITLGDLESEVFFSKNHWVSRSRPTAQLRKGLPFTIVSYSKTNLPPVILILPPVSPPGCPGGVEARAVSAQKVRRPQEAVRVPRCRWSDGWYRTEDAHGVKEDACDK